MTSYEVKPISITIDPTLKVSGLWQKALSPQACFVLAHGAGAGMAHPFPLHPAGRPSKDRAEHLFNVHVPMLFLQGMRDTLADLVELKPLCDSLRAYATLKLFPDADHSFHVPARSGRTDAEVLDELLDVLASWIQTLVKSHGI